MKQGIFLRHVAAESDEVVIDVVGVIGWEVWYTQMREMLRGIPESKKKVTFDIYSPGGDVWEGNGIVQEIGELRKRCKTVARVQMAASMATLIAVACDEREIARNGRFLVHNPWSATVGDADEMEKMAQTLRDCENEAVAFYAERTGQKPDAVRALMGEERWLMPEEAASLGFVQKISDPFKQEDYEAVKQEIVAAGKWPKALIEMPAEPPKQEEKKDEPHTDAGAATVPPVEQAAVPEAKHEEPESEDIRRGRADGEASGFAKGLAALDEEVGELKRRLDAAEKLASRLQSERDKLAAQLASANKTADERAANLREEITALTARLQKHLSGALTFQPAVESWEEALRACKGDYAEAAKKYPDLLKQYRNNAAQRQKESR